MRGNGRCMHQRRSIITKKASFLPSVATNDDGLEHDACLLLVVVRVTNDQDEDCSNTTH